QDVKTFISQIKKLANEFGCESIAMVGDRGMIKADQIADLNEEKFYYITATTKPQMETLLKQGIIQLELFTEKICEIEHEGIRYILRKNPERAKELEKSRNDKIEKIRELVNEKNKYLSDHARADVSTALSLVNEKIKKLNIESFTRIEESGRTLMVKVDENALRAESYLDGCYVIRSNLPVNEGSMET
ncbi:MAG: IS1634 family transposase, partial [Thermoplasmata archaeon]